MRISSRQSRPWMESSTLTHLRKNLHLLVMVCWLFCFLTPFNVTCPDIYFHSCANSHDEVSINLVPDIQSHSPSLHLFCKLLCLWCRFRLPGGVGEEAHRRGGAESQKVSASPHLLLWLEHHRRRHWRQGRFWNGSPQSATRAGNRQRD